VGSPTFTVSAAHSARVMLVGVPAERVLALLSDAHTADANLIHTLEPRELVIVCRGAYRVFRVA
jgi:hypothetical protein